jgi:hypothetical protein
MRVLRSPATFACLWLAAGCNALFGVEEPILLDSELAGGEGGALDLPQRGGGPSISPVLPQAGDGGESGAGGETGRPAGGEAGTQEPPATGGASGSGGDRDPPSGTGGIPVGTGGTSGAAPGGAGGSEPTITGAAAGAGAGGTGGSSSCGENRRRCADADTLEICEDGSPQKQECPHGCDDDACLPECTPPSIECRATDNSVRECGSDGRFGSRKPCTGQTCVPDVGCFGDCEPDEYRCNADNGDAERCVDGGWESSDVCAKDTQLCSLEAGTAECIQNDPRTVGFDVRLPQGMAFSVTPDVLRVYPLPEDIEQVDAFVLELGAIAGPAANAFMVLYADNGAGYPGALLGRTFTIAFSNLEDKKREIVPSTVLLQPEQRYWIGIVFANSGTPQLYCRDDDDAPGGFLVSQPFDSTIPSEFPSNALPVAGIECNLFVRVRTKTN